jgi:hypothetical protein
MSVFLAAVIWVIMELRIEGLARDTVGVAAVGSVFDAELPPTLPRTFSTVIAIAAALVTLRYAAKLSIRNGTPIGAQKGPLGTRPDASLFL